MVFNLSKEHGSLLGNTVLYAIAKLVLNYISYILLLVVVWLNFVPLLIIATTILSGLLENLLYIFSGLLVFISGFVEIPENIHF